MHSLLCTLKWFLEAACDGTLALFLNDTVGSQLRDLTGESTANTGVHHPRWIMAVAHGSELQNRTSAKVRI